MEEITTPIPWSRLIPKFDGLFSGKFTTTDLSAVIIAFMVIVAILSLLYVIYRAYRSSESIRFFHSLISDTTEEMLANRRRDIVERAKHRPYEGSLWSEFDETLVQSIDGRYLFNSVDASYFFNTHSLARGVTESRLVAALPGILTAMGVFGTFVGLQLGLGGLNLSDPSQTSQSIVPLINGAAVAFSTSVWGVGTSMLFNFSEKFIEQILRRKIYNLQQTIDSLFPRTSAEQTLVNIEHHSKQSEDVLKGLVEQIGEKMQTAVSEMASGIQAGIRDAMVPSIEKLVQTTDELASRQESGAERALGSLVERFSETVGKMGEAQKEGLERVAVDVRKSLDDWVGSMNGLTGELGTKVSELSKIESRREENFKATLAQLAHYQQRTTEQVDGVLSANLGIAQQLMERSKGVVEQGHNVNTTLAALAQKLEQSTGNLNETASRLSTLGEGVQGAARTLAEAQTRSATALERSAQDSRAVTESMTSLIVKIERASGGFNQVSQSLGESVKLANSTFDELKITQADYIEQLTKKVAEFSKQVDKMLVEYSERVQGQTVDRLNTWNEQTQAFLARMVDAIQTIDDVASELEGHLRPNRH